MTMRNFFIQDDNTEDVLYSSNGCYFVPNVGESIILNDKWYTVTNRVFCYNTLPHGTRTAECSIFVKEGEK